MGPRALMTPPDFVHRRFLDAGHLSARRRVALAIARKTGKHVGLDSATRSAVDADSSAYSETTSPPAREPAQKLDQIDELLRIVGEQEKDPRPRRAKVLTFPGRRRPPKSHK
jgi:hypothetical protein